MSEMEKTIAFYIESSDRDWGVVRKLFNSGDYGYSLFFCHLTLEKLLKALVVTKTNAPTEYTHQLFRLAELAEIELTPGRATDLKTITKFNIAGRYDDEKWEFRKQATKEYTEKYLKIAEELISWLKENYLKK